VNVPRHSVYVFFASFLICVWTHQRTIRYDGALVVTVDMLGRLISCCIIIIITIMLPSAHRTHVKVHVYVKGTKKLMIRNKTKIDELEKAGSGCEIRETQYDAYTTT